MEVSISWGRWGMGGSDRGFNPWGVKDWGVGGMGIGGWGVNWGGVLHWIDLTLLYTFEEA